MLVPLKVHAKGQKRTAWKARDIALTIT